MLLFLPSALSLGNPIFSHVPRYSETRTRLVSVPASFSKAATESSAEELSNHHFLLSVSKASSGLLSPGIRIFDWAIIGRPPIGSGLGLSPSHRLFWSTHVAQLHCISLYLAIEGLPPQSCPRPSLLLPVVPWQLCCLQSQSSPVPSQTRRSAAPASTVDLLAPEPALHLGNPTTPPTAATSAAHRRPPTLPLHDRLQNSLALFVLSCRSATPAPRPHLLYRPGQLQITHTLSAAARRTPSPPGLQSTWSQRPSATRRPFDSRRVALIIRPSLFGLDPALPTRIPSLIEYNPRRSLAPRAADLCLAIVPTIPPRPPPESPSHRRDPPPPHARPSAIGVGVGDCACCEKSRPRSINRPASAPFPPLARASACDSESTG